jgi:hypothetical protein
VSTVKVQRWIIELHVRETAPLEEDGAATQFDLVGRTLEIPTFPTVSVLLQRDLDQQNAGH